MKRSVRNRLIKEKGKNFCTMVCCTYENASRVRYPSFTTTEGKGEWRMIDNVIRWVDMSQYE